MIVFTWASSFPLFIHLAVTGKPTRTNSNGVLTFGVSGDQHLKIFHRGEGRDTAKLAGGPPHQLAVGAGEVDDVDVAAAIPVGVQAQCRGVAILWSGDEMTKKHWWPNRIGEPM